MTRPSDSRLFRSFWMAGFESSCHINSRGHRLDLIAATQHDQLVDEDYARLREMDIRTAREGMRWHRIDRGRRMDFSSLLPMVEAAERHGIQVLWNLCHYGWPEDVNLFSSGFVERFARYCGAVARLISDHTDTVPFYIPINEISFLAWATGEKAYIFPYARGRGHEIKQQLVRATIAGTEAIWEVDPRARILHVDPLIHVIPPKGHPELARAAADQRSRQFDAWDMLAGGLDPALGGHPRYLDVIGVNFYHSNEWEYPDQRLRWEDVPRDRRWIREVADEVRLAREMGVPMEGICLYPIIDRPDWEDPEHWHNSGLWDLRPDEANRLERVLCEDYAGELRQAQAVLAR
jgi:beta-glucosidase/6-phospho-beta-glucosidase/beta-galactosidase